MLLPNKRSRWKHLLIKSIVVVSIFAVAALLLYVSHFERILIKPLMTGVSVPSDYGDIIVVFGGGMRRDVNVQIGFSTLERLNQAVSLYQNREMPILVSDGSLYPKSPAIPLVIDYLVGKGVNRKRILIEGNSQTTRDNVENTVEIVKKLGFREMIVCTSPYHQKRCQVLLQKEQIKDFLIAENVDSEVYHAVSFGQRMRAFNLIFHEYMALLFLWISGIFQ